MAPHSPSRAGIGWRVTAPFVLVVGLLVALGLASVDILSSVRAYVGGESLWSKGRKEASVRLLDYLRSGDEAQYQRFEAALAVPLGDRQARLELDRADPDFDVVRAGFLQGGNHADDIPGMVRLYRNFRRVPFMADAIAIWAEADEQVVQLQSLVRVLRAGGLPLEPAQQRMLEQRVHALDEQLGALEMRFSARLGEASRTTRDLLVAATLALAVALATLAGLYVRHSLTQLAASERSLRESNQRWELAAAAGSIGVFEWFLADREVQFDTRAARLFDTGAAAPWRLTLDQLRERVHADDREPLQADASAALSSPAGWQMRYRIRRADGALRHLEAAGRRSGGRVIGLVWDVTDAVDAEQLRLDKEAAERASVAKSAFLSRASHELRTPLNAIIGFTEMMLADRNHPLSAQQAKRLQHVAQGGRYLLKLVNDMLDVTGIEHGAINITPADIDLAEVLAATGGLLEPLRRERDVTLVCTVPTGVAQVRGDRLRLEQVFVNLLSNAIKYNRSGGTVTCSAELAPEHVWVQVSDSGVGMSAEQLRSLFQPFNRLGAEFSGVAGAGLGLVVTRLLVERLGGAIEVHSQPGQGTRVRVRLPRSRPAAAGVTPALHDLT